MLSERSQAEKATCFPIHVHALAKAQHWGDTRSVVARGWGEGSFDYKSMQKFGGQFCSILTVAVVT